MAEASENPNIDEESNGKWAEGAFPIRGDVAWLPGKTVEKPVTVEVPGSSK